MTRCAEGKKKSGGKERMRSDVHPLLVLRSDRYARHAREVGIPVPLAPTDQLSIPAAELDTGIKGVLCAPGQEELGRERDEGLVERREEGEGRVEDGVGRGGVGEL